MILLLLIPIFLCWGSFLNVLAYRLINGTLITLAPSIAATRPSHCPHCQHRLAWYDLIPILSWVFLKGICRYCSQRISWLYPFIELLTTVALSLLCITILPHYFSAYFVFFSALIVTIRTDLQYMLISSFMTLYLIPIAFLWSHFGALPISFANSFAGALLGYGFLWITAKVFFYLTGRQGMGEGDFELLAFIGAFTGVLGCWLSLLIGSVVGSVIGIALLIKKPRYFRIPFGPFLAIGAMIYVIWQQQLVELLLRITV